MNFPIEKFRNQNTPFYYYDTELLATTLGTIKKLIAGHPNYHVHYAIKANANPEILKQIAAQGFGADCVSGGEIRAAINAGFPADKIVFAGVGKSDPEITLGIGQGILCFNVESIPELEVINEIAGKLGKTARVAFRINPNVDAHTNAKITTGLNENKFGIAMEDMEDAIRLAEAMDSVSYVGLHFHIGSQITSTAPFVALCNRINELQDKLEADGITTQSINVGGGLGIDYDNPDENPVPDFKSYFETFSQHLKLRSGQQLHFELGRSVVGQCGTLIAHALYVKQGHAKKFLILDAGFTELIRPAMYGSHHAIQNISSHEKATDLYDVVGPICESSDVFDKDVTLPVSHRGDFIALRSAGAYGEVMASTYNCRQLPKSFFSNKM